MVFISAKKYKTTRGINFTFFYSKIIVRMNEAEVVETQVLHKKDDYR